jgi:hypothetical protein
MSRYKSINKKTAIKYIASLIGLHLKSHVIFFLFEKYPLNCLQTAVIAFNKDNIEAYINYIGIIYH